MQQKHYILLAVFITVVACSKSITEKVFTGFAAPKHFPETKYNFALNPVTQAGFELGRQLFYDAVLSRNNTISCGSCHIQSSAFTQHGHDVSHGIDDRLGRRNSPPVMNLAWAPHFMWDGGIFNLDLQPISPITAHEEMDESVANVISKLQSGTKYPALFEKAFGSTTITTANFMKALSQFMLMCVSSNSKYDSVMQQRGNAQFTADELAGYQLVQQKCAPCHKEPLFTDFSFRNNGIGIGANNDMGRFDVTLNDADKYKFKVPSLRNLAYTPPYMHDGRFYTLEAVINHYSNTVQQTPNLDALMLQNNGQPGIPLTPDEKNQILAFLRTLNDKIFITNSLLSEQ